MMTESPATETSDKPERKETTTLSATCGYHPRFAPNNARKPYVARITGRHPKMTFERDFIGGEGKVFVDDPGLYETRDALKKGGCNDSYCVILDDPARGLRRTWVDKPLAVRIAKALGEGRRIDEVCHRLVTVAEDGSKKVSIAMVPSAQAKRVAAAASIDAAVDQCMAIMSALDDADRKRVLAELRKRNAAK